MRAIKFRGKDIKTGEWLYGNIQVPSKEDVEYFMWDRDLNQKEVIPDTVGQFTGLTDKNGKEIYEGDIITFDNHLQGVSQVVYDYAGFDVVSNNYRTTLRPMMNNHIRVIGNIHDNPELLKGENKKQ